MTLPRLLLPLAAALVALAPAPASAQDLVTTYRAAADSLIRAATGDSAAYARLARLVDGFGHRHAGSRSLEAAIDWILGEMKKDGLQNVRGEPVQVTHWMRGAETAVLQRAASALLAGRGGTGKGLAGSLGLDDLSVRPDSTSGAVVRVGKRFADNFYAAYERSLSGAMGTLFVFYDISRRLTLRLETGERTGLDLIFTFAFDRVR